MSIFKTSNHFTTTSNTFTSPANPSNLSPMLIFPTPSGVPVKNKSPIFKVKNCELYSFTSSIGKIIANVLGIEKGVVFDLLTSRLVGAALGAAIGKRI